MFKLLHRLGKATPLAFVGLLINAVRHRTVMASNLYLCAYLKKVLHTNAEVKRRGTLSLVARSLADLCMSCRVCHASSVYPQSVFVAMSCPFPSWRHPQESNSISILLKGNAEQPANSSLSHFSLMIVTSLRYIAHVPLAALLSVIVAPTAMNTSAS